MRNYVIDFDDLCDITMPRLELLDGLKSKYPDLIVTLFVIPQRTSDDNIRAAKERSWVHLAPHGWWHTRGECIAWTKEQSMSYIKAAADRGIDLPAFRAPAWLLDRDSYDACAELDYVICDHKDFHINIEGTKVYRYNDPLFRKGKITAIHGHLTNTPAVTNYVQDMLDDGRLDLNAKAQYLTPVEACVQVNVTDPGLPE